MEEDKLLVRKIKNGSVIDHIKAGNGLKVLDVLKITPDNTAVVMLNVQSKRFGKKDIVKIENKELNNFEINKIAILAPNATLNIIKDWKVVDKKKVMMPKIVEGILKCPNSNCITNYEPVKTRFCVEERGLRCWYCERIFRVNEVI